MPSEKYRYACVCMFKSQCRKKKKKMSFILKGQRYITSYLAFKGILLS